MSRPLPPEPPAKRQRAQGDGEEGTGGSGGLDEEQEYQRLAAVSLIQDELNALGEEEAQQVCVMRRARPCVSALHSQSKRSPFNPPPTQAVRRDHNARESMEICCRVRPPGDLTCCPILIFTEASTGGSRFSATPLVKQRSALKAWGCSQHINSPVGAVVDLAILSRRDPWTTEPQRRRFSGSRGHD